MPIVKHFVDNCNSIVDKSTNQYTCIVGDFNIGLINWTVANSSDVYSPGSAAGQYLLDFSIANNYKQCNLITNNKDKTLDLVFTDCPTCQTIPAADVLSLIDPLHPPIEFQLVLTQKSYLPIFRGHKLNFYRADYDAMNKHFGEIKWDDIFTGMVDVDDMTERLYDIIMDAIKQFVPRCQTKVGKYPPWYSGNLINRLRERNKYRQKYNKYQNPLDLISLKLLSKRCKKLTIECYNNYTENIEKNIQRNPKSFWSYIKSKREGSSTYPSSMSDGHVICTNAEDICNLFARHFSSVYVQDTSTTLPFLEDGNNADCYSMICVDREDLLKKLEGLDVTKGAGSDNIPPILFPDVRQLW
ncbi:hypothetical protein ABMA27_009833 [Loxostege sticticalis]|uniref:Endonuclease/exonuclease/phosphatase domain-containing protein n=1 Tax=Loxostege sticticalis TaxID=481309 RepID=A0ABR3H6Y3_LOXSC